MRYGIAFASGVLFAIGLAVGGMLEPARVIGFLDVFGRWDPQLAFVMGGGLAVNALAFRFTKKRLAPVAAQAFHLPSHTKVTGRLVAGSVLFGVGWGLSGYCPGPALTLLVSGTVTAFAFVGAMMAGMLVARFFEPRGEPNPIGGSRVVKSV